jgi:hypothetical protein
MASGLESAGGGCLHICQLDGVNEWLAGIGTNLWASQSEKVGWNGADFCSGSCGGAP